MTRRFSAMFALFCGALAGSAGAAQREVEIAADSGAYLYEEPGVMRLSGRMSGLSASVRYDQTVQHDTGRLIRGARGGENIALTLIGQGRLATGSADYSSLETGTADDFPSTLTDLRVLAGAAVSSGSTRLTTYLGLGRRDLVNDSSGRTSTTGHYGYRRQSNYIYTPVGLDLRIGLENRRRLLFGLEYDALFAGKQRSYLDDLTVGNRQLRGHGTRANAELGFSGWRIGLHYQRWAIDDSLPANGFYEPANVTRETGLRLGFAW